MDIINYKELNMMNVAIGLICMFMSFFCRFWIDKSADSKKEFFMAMKNVLFIIAIIYISVDIVCFLERII